ncbi:hypothetical protein GINT2_000806 [Glugoides intestinalis]
MSLISEIETLQYKIKNSVMKEMNIFALEDLNAFIEKEDFKEFFCQFDESQWSGEYYEKLKEELRKAKNCDKNKENADLVEVLKNIHREYFCPK